MKGLFISSLAGKDKGEEGAKHEQTIARNVADILEA